MPEVNQSQYAVGSGFGLVVGLGTASGVACPTFGMIAASGALAVGSTGAMIVGGICIGVFAIVTIPIFAWVASDHLKEKQALKNEMQAEKDNFDQLILNYLLNTMRYARLVHKSQLINHIKQMIVKDMIEAQTSSNNGSDKLKKTIAVLNDLVEDGDENFWNAILNFDDSENKNLRSSITTKIADLSSRDKNKVTHKNFHFKPSYANEIKNGVMGFAGAYGCIVGCSAGIVSLLTGMGFIAGLASVPVAGWCILSVGLLVGIGMGMVYAYNARQNEKKKQLLSCHKENNEFLANVSKSKESALRGALEYHQAEKQRIKAMPEISEPMPEISKPMPEISKPMPEISEPMHHVRSSPIPIPPQVSKNKKNSKDYFPYFSKKNKFTFYDHSLEARNAEINENKFSQDDERVPILQMIQA